MRKFVLTSAITLTCLTGAGFGVNEYVTLKDELKEVKTELKTETQTKMSYKLKSEELTNRVAELDAHITGLQTEADQKQARIIELEKTVTSRDLSIQDLKNQLKAEKERPRQLTSLPSRGAHSPVIRSLRVKATAYSSDPAENGGTYNGKVLTATGFNLTDNPSAKIIAVDPNVIPLNSLVRLTSASYPSINGVYLAADTGGAIKGNRIDVFIANKTEVNKFGVRNDIILDVLREGK